jgi:hypothetical protein
MWHGVMVSASSVYRDDSFASEMLTEFKELIRLSHWTRRAQAIVPAALVYRKRRSPVEMLIRIQTLAPDTRKKAKAWQPWGSLARTTFSDLIDVCHWEGRRSHRRKFP